MARRELKLEQGALEPRHNECQPGRASCKARRAEAQEAREQHGRTWTADITRLRQDIADA